MIGIDGVDWLVLSKQRERDKLAAFLERNERFGLPIQEVAATEGSEVDLQELVQLDLVDAGISGWSKEAIGDALSHWLCWHQSVETQRPACIFEPDAILRHDFLPRLNWAMNAVPLDWELVHLGFDTSSTIDMQIMPDNRLRGRMQDRDGDSLNLFVKNTDPAVPLKLINSFGAFAYFVSPLGAKRLIENVFPLKTQYFSVSSMKGRLWTTRIDLAMNRHYTEMPAYVCFPPLARSTVELKVNMDDLTAQKPDAVS